MAEETMQGTNLLIGSQCLICPEKGGGTPLVSESGWAISSRAQRD